MVKNLTKVAFIYDFDETLSTTYMQDYILIPALGDKPEQDSGYIPSEDEQPED